MSMDCDTRLSMMALQDRTHHAEKPRRTRSARRVSSAAASTVAAMATFALTLFTRSV